MNYLASIAILGLLSGCAVPYHSISAYPNPTDARAAVTHCIYEAEMAHPSLGLVAAMVNLNAVNSAKDDCMMAYGYAPNP